MLIAFVSFFFKFCDLRMLEFKKKTNKLLKDYFYTMTNYVLELYTYMCRATNLEWSACKCPNFISVINKVWYDKQ